MWERDLFVAMVALGLGLFLVFASVSNNDRYFEMRTPAAMVRWLGRHRTRCLVGVVGLGLIGIGGMVVHSGWTKFSSRSVSEEPNAALNR
jgi:hypothetical protein